MSPAESELQAREPPAQPVERLLAAFGGVQALARRLDLPVATVEEWRTRGSVPRERLPAIAAAAERDGLALDPAVLAQSARAAPTIDAEPAPSNIATAPKETRGERPRWLPSLPSYVPAIVFGGLLVVAGFLLAMGTSSLWLGPPTDWAGRVETLEKDGARAIDGLNAKVADLEQQLASLKQQVEALPPGVDRAELDSLGRDLLAEVDRRLAAVPAADPARLAAIEASLAALGRQVEALSRQQAAAPPVPSPAPAPALAPAPAPASPPASPAESPSAAPPLSAAADALAAKVDAGEPYAAELAAVQDLGSARPELAAALAALGPGAGEGVATLEELRGELTQLAQTIVDAGRAPASGDVLDDLASDLSQLLGGRPVGEVEGDSVEARVARAELHLEEGDLAAALAELRALEGAPAAAAAPWLQRAEARLAATGAAAELRRLASAGN